MKTELDIFDIQKYWDKATEELDKKAPNLIEEIDKINEIAIEFLTAQQQFRLSINGETKSPDLNFTDLLTFIFILANYDNSETPVTPRFLKNLLETIPNLEDPNFAQLAPNPTILAFALADRNSALKKLALLVANSAAGFDYLKDAVNKMGKNYLEGFIHFYLPPTGEEPILKIVYGGNEEGFLVLENFIYECLSVESDEARKYALEVLKDIFVSFINKGKEAVLGDMVKIIIERIRNTNNPNERPTLTKILSGSLDKMRKSRSEIFAKFLNGVVDKELLVQVSDYVADEEGGIISTEDLIRWLKKANESTANKPQSTSALSKEFFNHIGTLAISPATAKLKKMLQKIYVDSADLTISLENESSAILYYLCGVPVGTDLYNQSLERLDEIIDSDINFTYFHPLHPYLIVAYVNNQSEIFNKILKKHNPLALKQVVDFLEYSGNLNNDEKYEINFDFIRYLFSLLIISNENSSSAKYVFQYAEDNPQINRLVLIFGTLIAKYDFDIQKTRELKAAFYNFTTRAIQLGQSGIGESYQLMIDLINQSTGDVTNDLVTILALNLVKTIKENQDSTTTIQQLLDQEDTPLSLLSKLFEVSFGKIEGPEQYKKQQPDFYKFIVGKIISKKNLIGNVFDLDLKQVSLMSLCCAKGSLEDVQYFITQGFVLEKENLIYAFKYKNTEVIKFLLEMGEYEKLTAEEQNAARKNISQTTNGNAILRLINNHEDDLAKQHNAIIEAQNKATEQAARELKRKAETEKSQNKNTNIENLKQLLIPKRFQITESNSALEIRLGNILCDSILLKNLESKILTDEELDNIKKSVNDALVKHQESIDKMRQECDKIECLLAKLNDYIKKLEGNKSNDKRDIKKDLEGKAQELEKHVKNYKAYKKEDLDKISKLIKSLEKLGISVKEEDLEGFKNKKEQQEQAEKLKQEAEDNKRKKKLDDELKRKKDIEVAAQKEKSAKEAILINRINAGYNEILRNLIGDNFIQQDLRDFWSNPEIGINSTNIDFHKPLIKNFVAKAFDNLGVNLINQMVGILDICNQINKKDSNLLDVVDLFGVEKVKQLENIKQINATYDTIHSQLETKNFDYQKLKDLLLNEELGFCSPENIMIHKERISDLAQKLQPVTDILNQEMDNLSQFLSGISKQIPQNTRFDLESFTVFVNEVFGEYLSAQELLSKITNADLSDVREMETSPSSDYLKIFGSRSRVIVPNPEIPRPTTSSNLNPSAKPFEPRIQ